MSQTYSLTSIVLQCESSCPCYCGKCTKATNTLDFIELLPFESYSWFAEVSNPCWKKQNMFGINSSLLLAAKIVRPLLKITKHRPPNIFLQHRWGEIWGWLERCVIPVHRDEYSSHFLNRFIWIFLCSVIIDVDFIQGPQGPQGVQGERGTIGEGLPGPKVS